MILVDSSVWIDFLRDVDNPATDQLVALLTAGRNAIGIGDLVVMEILQGAKNDARAQAIAERFEPLPKITICDPELAITAAKNCRFLRSRGITIRKTIDTLIATRCIVDGYSLLYSDRDFDPFVQHLGMRSAMA